jgi:transposase-like protein
MSLSCGLGSIISHMVIDMDETRLQTISQLHAFLGGTVEVRFRVTAKILGVPTQTLGNWVRLSNKGQLKGAGDKPVSPEQMELARLRAENARLRMERDILGKATAYFAKGSL